MGPQNLKASSHCDAWAFLVIGRGGATKSDEFSKKCQRGGRGLFQSKTLCSRFWELWGFLTMNLILNSNFNVQDMVFQQLYWEKSKPDTLWRRHFTHTRMHACIFYYLALIPPCIYATKSIIKNLHHNFPKMRGGIKGRLEFFQKFIRFVTLAAGPFPN